MSVINLHRRQKSIKNVKINFKRIKLSKDISLTNLKSNSITKQELTTLNFSKGNLSHFYNYSCTKTESCQLKTCPTNKNDNLIFKKPIPVAKKSSQSVQKRIHISKTN